MITWSSDIWALCNIKVNDFHCLVLSCREKEEEDRLEEEVYFRQQSMVRRALEHVHTHIPLIALPLLSF